MLFFVFIVFFITILCNILFHNDIPQAIPVNIGTITNPKPVIDKVTDVDVAPMKTILSTDFNIVVIV